MILYFTGTGNSRYAAEGIGQVTGESVVPMNGLIKSGQRGTFHSDSPYVFVCPTYAWRVPRIVEDFLSKSSFSGSRMAYFVLTCGSDTGNAAAYARRLCEALGLEFMGLGTVVMPENYIALYAAPGRAEAEDILRRAVPQITVLAEDIRSGRPFPSPSESPLKKFSSAVVNPVFYRLIVGAERFYATDACVACGKCAELCPLNNIRLGNGRPDWGGTCTHCMACICGCPKEAIEYGRHTRNKIRYFNRESPAASR